MIEVTSLRFSVREKNGTYLLGREPKIGERIMVINEDNRYAQQYGTIVDRIDTWSTFGVKLDLYEDKIIDFYRFEIAWDHGH